MTEVQGLLEGLNPVRPTSGGAGRAELRPLEDRASLESVVADDPFLRHDVVSRPDRAWALGSAVAVTRTSHRGLAGVSVWARLSPAMRMGPV